MTSSAPPPSIADLVAVDPVFGCWLWAAKLDDDGYGTRHTAGGPRQAHRSVYVELVGRVARGLKLDHNCRRRRCCNPAHLEPVTESENQLRRSLGYRARRAVCQRGHSMATAMMTPEGGRLCRECQGPPRADDGGDFSGVDRQAAEEGPTT